MPSSAEERKKRIDEAREKAAKRVTNRGRHIKAHGILSTRRRNADIARKKKQKQIASLKKQGRHVDVASAKEQYKILSEDYASAQRAARKHAMKAQGAGAGKGNFKGTLKQADKAKAAATVRDAVATEQAARSKAPGRQRRPSAPGVTPSSSKKPKSTTPKVSNLTKEQYKNLVKQRSSQADKNYGKYGTDNAKRKGSAGQKIYNDYDKKIKNSKYSYKSHVAAMKRRGKKATASSYAKFKRYNGI